MRLQYRLHLSLFPLFAVWTKKRTATELLDDHRALEPPDPIPNSEVKRRIADGSVGLPHVRVGHRQAHTPNPRSSKEGRGFVFARKKFIPVTPAHVQMVASFGVPAPLRCAAKVPMLCSPGSAKV